MDYTKVPRILVYKERSSLEQFGVYEPNTFNAVLYEALMSLDDLKPRRKGAFREILQLFNDAYYFLTIILLEQNPIERYAEYCEEAVFSPKDNQFDWNGESKELVVKCMLFVMLRTFGKNLTPPQQRLLKTISDDIDDCAHNDMGTTLRRLRGEEEDVVYKITCNFLNNHMLNSIYYTRRDIQELLNDEISLKDCLYAGKTLRESVNTLCKDNKQKLALIDRLLEPEKEDFGVFNSTICSAYQSLYELKSELTGEPLPEELPFEKASACILPMTPTPPSIHDYQEKDSVDDKDAKIAELEKKVKDLNKELSNFHNDTESGSQLQKLTDAQKRIDELEETIKDLNKTILKYQMRGLPPAKRKGIALGLTPIQADIFGDFLATKLGIDFSNKKEELSLILNCLFGYGRSSLANKMHKITEAVDERLYVASIFGTFSPSTAKDISPDWTEDILAPWEKEEENDYDDNDFD